MSGTYHKHRLEVGLDLFLPHFNGGGAGRLGQPVSFPRIPGSNDADPGGDLVHAFDF